ncbi:MAG TPA: DUF1175 family protein [Terriglobales bacterium]|nr:DUF1175 family protein [Terriglobales bacterium]
MTRLSTRRWWLLPLALMLAVVAFGLVRNLNSGPHSLVLEVDHASLPADGYARGVIKASSSDGRKVENVRWRIKSGEHLVTTDISENQLRLRSGIVPGDVRIAASHEGFKPAEITLHLGLDPTDQFGDGTPDFLRLQDQADRDAFRNWFAFLAESAYVQKEEDRPKEINDCAALIRFAYREALRTHDGVWANQWHLGTVPNAPSVRKYDYPHTALGAGLFRIREGAFSPDDVSNGAFAEFADAETLRRYNTHYVSRDLRAARPGDVLFFRQTGQRMPFHTMIFLGQSHFGDGDNWLVYHTGPSEGHAGEIRRVTVEDLMHHPEVRWRPLPQNPAFMGIYRWNILREAD